MRAVAWYAWSWSRRGERLCTTHILPFIHSGMPAHRWCSPVFRASLPTSANPMSKLPHGPAQGFISKGIPDSLKWTTNVNYCKYLHKVFNVSGLGSRHANICVAVEEWLWRREGPSSLAVFPSLTMSFTRSRKQFLKFSCDTEVVVLAVTVESTGSGSSSGRPSDLTVSPVVKTPTGITMLTLPKSLEISYLKFMSSWGTPPVELVLVWCLLSNFSSSCQLLRMLKPSTDSDIGWFGGGICCPCRNWSDFLNALYPLRDTVLLCNLGRLGFTVWPRLAFKS